MKKTKNANSDRIQNPRHEPPQKHRPGRLRGLQLDQHQSHQIDHQHDQHQNHRKGRSANQAPAGLKEDAFQKPATMYRTVE